MTRPKAVKGARKRRLPRLSSAILLEAMLPAPDDMVTGDGILTQKWEPTKAHWCAIEKFCGGRTDREEIGNLVANYFQIQPFEKSAPFESDAETHLDKLQRAADGFYQVLLSGEELENETLERNAAIHIGMCISINLEKTHCALTSIADFTTAMEGFLAAAIVARHELNACKGKRFVEGESWNRLVRDLAQWYDSKGLRATASKSGNMSPFVALISVLQSTFPERFRRHHHSDGALAKAVSAVLAGP